jgi:BirA family biotin operon repressor/biotin-[acetyl-CoA-carboxylase] ligase
VLERLRSELERWFAASEDVVREAWRARADTLGRRVRVELPGEVFEGVAGDLAEDGSLVVAGRVLAAGDVIHLRDASAPEGSPRSAP